MGIFQHFKECEAKYVTMAFFLNFFPFSFSSELTTPASNFGAVTLTTSISAKLKRAPRWMAQSVHQER